MASAKYHCACAPSTFPNYLFQDIFKSRKRIGKIESNNNNNNAKKKKKANLCATKKERIRLPSFDDQSGFHISKFLSHPSGFQAILNTRALRSYQSIGSNVYRCTLPQVQLLNFEVAPVIDLKVTTTDEDCTVELLSCKFEGSEILERQNERFSASMRNQITWETLDAEVVLNVDVMLNLVLEIYTQPFTFLPVSAVETPGNIMMQALVDRLVPLLVSQLLHDYEEWVRQQRECLE